MIALTACAVAPRQPLDLAKALAAQQSRSLDQVRAASTDAFGNSASPDRFWDTDALVDAAWQLRSEVAIADAEGRAADADRSLARRRSAPTLSLTPEFAVNAGGSSPWVIAAAFGQAFEPAARRQPRIDQSDARWHAAGWHAAAVRWQVASEVREAQRRFALVLERRSSLASEQLLRRRIVELTQRRVEAGVVGAAELATARLASAQVDLLAAAADQAREAARATLAAAVGVGVQDLLRHQVLPPALEPPSSASLPDPATLRSTAAPGAALLDRLDVAAALAAYDEAEAAERSDAATRTPLATLAPGYTFDQGTRKLTFGLSAELPSSGRRADAARAATARREAAALHVDEVLAQALAQIDQADAAATAAANGLAAAAQVIAAQDELARRAESRWHAGTATQGEALLAQAELEVAKRGRIDALAAVLDAVHALELALERPLWPASRLAPPHPATATPDAPPPGDPGRPSPATVASPPSDPSESTSR